MAHLKEGFFNHSINAILETECPDWGKDYESALESGELKVELIDTRASDYGTVEGKFRMTNAAGTFEGWFEDGIGAADIDWVEA